MAASGLAVGVDATVFEPNDPHLVQLDIRLARLPEAFDGLRIAQLSDFHYDPYFSVVPIRKAVETVNRLKPDLIVLTGDFITVPELSYGPERTKGANAIDPCAALLSTLHAPSGVIGVLGNHDVASDPERIVNSLKAHGIPILRNAAIPLERGHSRIWLAGVDDIMEGNPDLHATLQPVPNGEAVVLMAHEPDFAPFAARHPIDFQLSGHSHGGQIRLPLLGAPYLPPLGRNYPMGSYRIHQLVLYTNVGIGTIRIPVRWNCPPEITIFTLRSPAWKG